MPNYHSYRHIHVRKVSNPRHLESVQLNMGSRPTGILFKRDEAEGLGMEMGAVLGFLKDSTGRIQTAAWPFEMREPFQEEEASPRSMLFGPIFDDPNNLSMDAIHEIVSEFLCWSNTTTQFPVKGFKGTKDYWKSKEQMKPRKDIGVEERMTAHAERPGFGHAPDVANPFDTDSDSASEE